MIRLTPDGNAVPASFRSGTSGRPRLGSVADARPEPGFARRAAAALAISVSCGGALHVVLIDDARWMGEILARCCASGNWRTRCGSGR